MTKFNARFTKIQKYDKKQLLTDTRLSLYRRLEMKHLQAQRFSGLVLDLGGAEISGYHQLLQGAEYIIRINNDINYGCEIVANIEESLPIRDNVAHHVVCLNVLEHIFNYKNVIVEAYRILRPAGVFYMGTPFLFQIHGSPSDYFRFTDTAIDRILKEAGFRVVKIYPFGYGIFSACYQLLYGLFPRFSRGLLELLIFYLDQFAARFSKRSLVNNYPLGYFTIGIK